ncbi:MAG: sel1 repeat family protein [Pseudomonadota bacterium]|nr:sel1 repeat family protein [Pseudomonadota bacterium]
MVGRDFRDALRRLCRQSARRRRARRGGRRFRRARQRDLGRAGRARGDGGGDQGGRRLRAAGLALAALVAAGGAARAVDFNSPMFEAPLSRQIGPDAPLQPKPGDPPGDIAFGAYQRGYFLTALREAEKRLTANPRDAAAMTLIGEIYHDGLAVARDDKEAVGWWKLGAENGDAQGAYEYGVALLAGTGVAADRAAARKYFLQAADKGKLAAIYNLGALALQGEAGAPPDFAAAAAYFRRAAEAGDGNSAYSYGVLLREGRGVPLDTDKAAQWLKRAADEGIVAGQVEYAIMLFNGVGVDKDEQAAAKIFELAAARRNPIAQNRLAHLYLSGRGVAKDIVRAALWNGLANAAGLKDEKLDKAIGTLTPEQVDEVRKLARRQAEF